MRTSRAPLPILTKEEDPFVIGKANVLRAGHDATVIACGVMVSEAMSAAEKLKLEGIDLKVVNMHTIKPIDTEMIISSAKETGAIVTAEEHQMAGGLGSAVAEVLGQHYPCPLEIVGVKDSFGESGSPTQLLAHYGLKDTNIVDAVKKVITRKVTST
jgi:transketolase